MEKYALRGLINARSGVQVLSGPPKIIDKFFNAEIILLDQEMIKAIECEYREIHSLTKTNSEGCQIEILLSLNKI